MSKKEGKGNNSLLCCC